MTRTARIALIFTTALAAFAIASPSTAVEQSGTPRVTSVTAPVATGCAKPAPSTAAGYAKLWGSLPVTEWGGGDVSISVRLADGRRLWLYGDTFSSGKFVHSSAVVQDRGCVRASRQGAQVLPNGGVDVVYWIEAAEAVKGGVLIHAEETRIGDGGVWDFAYTGFMRTAFVTVDAKGDVTFKRWVSRVKAPKADPGQLIDLPGPAFGYSVREHTIRLASGERLVTMARNYDDGLHTPREYAPLWFEGMNAVPR